MARDLKSIQTRAQEIQRRISELRAKMPARRQAAAPIEKAPIRPAVRVIPGSREALVRARTSMPVTREPLRTPIAPSRTVPAVIVPRTQPPITVVASRPSRDLSVRAPSAGRIMGDIRQLSPSRTRNALGSIGRTGQFMVPIKPKTREDIIKEQIERRRLQRFR